MRDEPISEASIPTGNQRENLSSFPDFRSSIGRLLFGGIIENVPDFALRTIEKAVARELLQLTPTKRLGLSSLPPLTLGLP